MDTGRKDPRGLFKATQREDYEVSTLIPLPLHQPCVPLRPSIKPRSHRFGGEDWCRTDLQDNMACNEFCDQAGVWVSVDHGNYDLTCQGIVFTLRSRRGSRLYASSTRLVSRVSPGTGHNEGTRVSRCRSSPQGVISGTFPPLHGCMRCDPRRSMYRRHGVGMTRRAYVSHVE